MSLETYLSIMLITTIFWDNLYLNLIAFLAIFGILETFYLIKKRTSDKKPVCLIGGDCSTVLYSKYNKTLGIHNDLLGLTFYFVLAVLVNLILFSIVPIYWANILLGILIVVGSIFSVVFTYIQWRIIKSWCFWCLMSAFTNWAILIVFLLYNNFFGII